MTKNYQPLTKNAPSPETLCKIPPLPAFSETALAFVEALSATLMHDPRARAFPELTALAFWMRKANLERLRVEMAKKTVDALLVPRGTVFHIAPSNVDTIFVYSWFLALLTGNRNIVRLSSKPSAQADRLIEAIATLLASPTHAAIAQRTLLLKYAADDQITTELSAVSDVRIIWGGDTTVRHIRQLPLPPTSIDIAFANKYSLALVHASQWINATEETKSSWINAFYNDAYWFDQMACSSPRLLLWVGTRTECQQAAASFWPLLEKVLQQKRTRFNDIDYVNKRVTTDSLAIETSITLPEGASNTLTRVWFETPALHEGHHCGAGLFFESWLPALTELSSLLSRKVQTVSYAGFTKEELIDFIHTEPLAGIDRFVPFGRALDFSIVWDGFDLIRSFMREITVS